MGSRSQNIGFAETRDEYGQKDAFMARELITDQGVIEAKS